MSSRRRTRAESMKAFIRSIARRFLPQSVREARARRADFRQHEKYEGLPVEKVFSDIYRTKEWGGDDGEFYSGTGSHDPAVVAPYVAAVRCIMQSLPRKPVIVDIGSGDFNIGSHFIEQAAHYFACDVVPELQTHNRQKFGAANVEFLSLDATRDPLPAGDIICIRQVLQHLSNAQIVAVVEKCKAFDRWIITEHLPADPDFVPNIDIHAGCGIRMLVGSGVVLTAPPFAVKGYSVRTLCEVPEYGGLIRTQLFERSSD